MRYGILEQSLKAGALPAAVVLFWPVWFLCSGVLAIAMKMMAWEPPLPLVILLAIAPVVMLFVGFWIRSQGPFRFPEP